MNLLQVKGISKKDTRGFYLHNINFIQQPRQNIAIAGETGSGKTTLLKIIAGLTQPDEGEVLFQNERVIGPADKLIPGHKGIVYLSQNFRLPGFLRVEQVLEYANEWRVEDAEKLFSICRLSHLFKRRTDELSGGEQQRIAIARLLVMDPKLFLLDEPFSNMDLSNKTLLKKVIGDISDELNISFIMVSHDPIDTLSWANKVLVMKDGQIIEENTAQRIYANPETEYTAGLFGRYNELPADKYSELAIATYDESLSSLRPTISSKESSAPSDYKFIFRPEDCVISSSDTLTPFDMEQAVNVPAAVVQSRYYGHYTETDVAAGDQVITTRGKAGLLQAGDQITLQIKKDAIRLVRSLSNSE